MFKKISDILNNTVPYTSQKRASSSPHESIFNFLKLIEKWETIVGPNMAKHTIPLKNVRKTLTIVSNHPAYSQELSFLQTHLIKKIVELFPSLQGQIRQIRFQTNSHIFKHKKEQTQKTQKKAPRWHRFSPEVIRLKKEIQDHLKDIHDPELLRLLTSLYIQKKQADAKAPKEA